MVWALIFDGVNDSATATIGSSVTGNFELSGEVIVSANQSTTTALFTVVESSTSESFGIGISSTNNFKLFSRAFTPGDSGVSVVVGQKYAYKVTLDNSGNAELFIDNISVHSLNNPTLNTFTYNSALWAKDAHAVDFYFCQHLTTVFKDNSVVINSWDATPSNHGAGTPVLVDTVGSNNATGVNMPTDGSAWINLGVAPSVSIPVIMNHLRNQGIS